MTNPEHDLHTFMAQITHEMASEYDRIYAKTCDDPGTAGDEGEENWATLLREWLPPAYHVATKGRLISSDGRMSPQIDVLVLKPFYPRKLQEKKVWLANGVAAVFECKTTLRAEHISASAERCQAFKALFPRREGSPLRELRSSLVYGILAHSHAWKAPASKPADNVSRAVREAMEQAKHPTDVIDLICVADVGCWSELVAPFYKAAFQPTNTAELETIFGGDWGPVSTMTCATSESGKNFQPVGGMLAYLTQRLAWNDPSVRDLADYYRLANLWGDGSGPIRYWPQSVFSNEVCLRIERGELTQRDIWNEWNACLM
ncbi:hypothetical protein ATCC53582_02905 [Novacetimonas hansenii]|uniref:DUF6602 domain-containing protein n=2 Tax=Novacetimonas hansenii TaxID=436 RepID=UPI000794E41C|nr:DUF6602 domain-containing protein [Novacetimonas hansenii]RFP04114.1 hypothetical protein BGC30_00195 [Novacetimonas hansenii]WEQ60524.1 hypothetical protein LV563_15015 [Novacetimonas hansenii]CUW48758.1 hypothetical protein ATCC53582_02905 [Novacetimonas hansenii]